MFPFVVQHRFTSEPLDSRPYALQEDRMNVLATTTKDKPTRAVSKLALEHRASV